jgi:hypothetical protein
MQKELAEWLKGQSIFLASIQGPEFKLVLEKKG